MPFPLFPNDPDDDGRALAQTLHDAVVAYAPFAHAHVLQVGPTTSFKTLPGHGLKPSERRALTNAIVHAARAVFDAWAQRSPLPLQFLLYPSKSTTSSVVLIVGGTHFPIDRMDDVWPRLQALVASFPDLSTAPQWTVNEFPTVGRTLEDACVVLEALNAIRAAVLDPSSLPQNPPPFRIHMAVDADGRNALDAWTETPTLNTVLRLMGGPSSEGGF